MVAGRLSLSEIAALKAVEALIESRIHLSRPNARGIPVSAIFSRSLAFGGTA